MKAATLLSRMALVFMVALPLAACASSHKMSSQKLCEAAGGKYAGGTCNPGSSKSAVQMCEAHGGVYLAGQDYCDIPIM